MHWFTWQQIIELSKTWQGLAVAIVGAATAIYYGLRKILETWDWYVTRFVDDPVLEVLREQALVRPEDRPHPLQGFSVGELATKLNRSHQSIGKSIRRLRQPWKDRILFRWLSVQRMTTPST